MFIEFIDALRCTNPHEDSWLVASFARNENRFILEGTLGCPVCYRQYPIRNGVAYFGDAPERQEEATQAPVEAMAAAAFLDASERATLVLAGSWALAAGEIVELLPLRVFALNAPSSVQESESVALMVSTQGIPLAPVSIRGIAVDTPTATPENIASALRALMPAGRLVAPVDIDVPAGVEVMARDEHFWVGQKVASLVPLRRG